MIKIDGPWKEGYAFDIHTIRSDYTGEDQYGRPIFDTTRSEMGQYIYELKYEQDLSVLEKIKKLLVNCKDIKDFISKIDIIIPVPPSNKGRQIQPVRVCSEKLAEIYKKKLETALVSSTNEDELKSTPTEEKYDKIKSRISISDKIDKESKFLLFDDVYDSGNTLSAITNALKEKGCKNIYVFTLTKTRKAD